MCLNDIVGGVQVADRNITAYKVTVKNSSSGSHYAPFYNTYRYDIGKVLQTDLDLINPGYSGFHTYVRLADALASAEYLKYHKGWYDEYFTVMKVYIPKGSNYYQGNYDGNPSYASNKMLIVRPVTVFDSVYSLLKNAFRPGRSAPL